MTNHQLLGGELQLYRRGKSQIWHCSASIGRNQHRSSTREESFPHAKQIAEDWYFELRGKSRAGLLRTEKTFHQAADQFSEEYGIITEGRRSPRWVEGHNIRLRPHLLPFFGELGVSEVTASKVQEYAFTGRRPRPSATCGRQSHPMARRPSIRRRRAARCTTRS